jgi:glutathione S-transferase
MITVHHLNHSRSQRVLWLLEELGLPYEIRHYQRNAKTMLAPPELKAVHALGKSPVITDGAITVAETGAIIEYLVSKADGALKPKATEDARRYTYWLHYAEGSLMPLMIVALLMGRIAAAPWPVRPIAKAIAGQVRKAYLGPNLDCTLAFIESELSQRPWFAGADFSAADVQMSFPLQAAAARGGMDARYPQISAWLARVEARPAYQTALAKGGPFQLIS